MQFLLGSPGPELGVEMQPRVPVLPLGTTPVRQLPRGEVLGPSSAQAVGVAVRVLPGAWDVGPLAQDGADQGCLTRW